MDLFKLKKDLETKLAAVNLLLGETKTEAEPTPVPVVSAPTTTVTATSRRKHLVKRMPRPQSESVSAKVRAALDVIPVGTTFTVLQIATRALLSHNKRNKHMIYCALHKQLAAGKLLRVSEFNTQPAMFKKVG